MPEAIAQHDEIQATRAPIVERRYLVAFALVTCLFLSWALAAALNDVLIRQFQKALALSRTESSLIQFAFYIGYFCAALPAGLLIRRFGYKRTILTGLSLYALGAFLFYPAAAATSFGFFLAALYIIAFGLAFLETSANPYVSILGAPQTASARLNLAQSFYGIGAILGPLIGGFFIFSGVEHSKAELAAMAPAELAAYRASEAQMVQMPYLIIGIAVCVLGYFVWRTPFPALEAERPKKGGASTSAFAVLRHRHLRWAVVAQFFYVGAQVGIWSFFIDFAKAAMPHLSERTTAFLLSASLAMIFIGRFSGAFIQRRIPAPRLLLIYAIANVGLCLIAAFAVGPAAVGALWLTSFFMSIMFPTIFALGISDLGEETNLASSFLIMSIIGGALIPPAMGLLSDTVGGIQHAMLIPMLCFAVCALFAIAAPRLIAGNAEKAP
jgi:FHS family L-fucose permease-like MFS transporter